jgi:hypothetical protein
MTIRMPGVVNRRLYLEPWYDNTLSGTGRFDVSNIPPLATTLRLVLHVRTTQATTSDVIYLFFNGDTTLTNYRAAVWAGGTTNAVSVEDTARIGTVPGASSPANYFGICDIRAFSYADTTIEKMASSFGGGRETATTIYNRAHLLHWETSAAINRITLQPDGWATDSFAAGSRLQIWLLP